jgi:hypothetical protein
VFTTEKNFFPKMKKVFSLFLACILPATNVVALSLGTPSATIKSTAITKAKSKPAKIDPLSKDKARHLSG